jgi:hypothetical protein
MNDGQVQNLAYIYLNLLNALEYLLINVAL